MSRYVSKFLIPFLLTAATARADVQTRGPEVFPGNNEISLHLGGQFGLTTSTVNGFPVGGAPDGGHFIFDYARLLSDRRSHSVWLDMGLSLTANGGGFANCQPNGYCSYGPSGTEVAPFFGVKVKFRTDIPLVPYAKLDAQFTGIFNRFCGDNGFGPLAHVAGGAKYFLTSSIGLGIETGLSFGPAFYSGANCVNYSYGAHVELYAAADLTVGVEFIF